MMYKLKNKTGAIVKCGRYSFAPGQILEVDAQLFSEVLDSDRYLEKVTEEKPKPSNKKGE